MPVAASAQPPTRLWKHSDSEISDAKPSMPSILHLPCWLDSGRLWMRTRSRTFTSGKPTYLGLRKLPSSWNDYDLILSTSMLDHLPKEELPSALSALRSRLAQNGALLVVITRKNLMTKFLIEWWWHARRYSRRDLQGAFAPAVTMVHHRVVVGLIWRNLELDRMGQIWHSHPSPHRGNPPTRDPYSSRHKSRRGRGLYGKKRFSERLAQLRKAARSSVLKTSRQRSA